MRKKQAFPRFGQGREQKAAEIRNRSRGRQRIIFPWDIPFFQEKNFKMDIM